MLTVEWSFLLQLVFSGSVSCRRKFCSIGPWSCGDSLGLSRVIIVIPIFSVSDFNFFAKFVLASSPLLAALVHFLALAVALETILENLKEQTQKTLTMTTSGIHGTRQRAPGFTDTASIFWGLHRSSQCGVVSKGVGGGCMQCDQIGQFIGLWAPF